MTLVMKRLSRDDTECLHSMLKATYLDGDCYAFAIALHRELWWPMYGLITNGTDGERVIRHAFVDGGYARSGIYFDARGWFNEASLSQLFGVSRASGDIAPVTEDDLRAVRPVRESSIANAARMAEVLWPDLPWKGRLRRVEAFARELEELSRKHGFWVTGPTVTTWPALYEGSEDVAGYTVTPTPSANAYLISRRLEGAKW